MADPGVFEIASGATLSLLVLKEVFGFIRPLIPQLNGKAGNGDKVTMALLAYKMDKMEATVSRIDTTVNDIDKQIAIHLDHHEGKPVVPVGR